MDNVKNTFLVILSVITALFISFCIALTSPGFRGFVNNMFGLVPQGDYKVVIDEKTELLTKAELCSQEINTLNNEKQILLDKIASLDLTNTNQSQEIVELKAKVDELNSQITILTDRLNGIATQLDNASLVYIGTQLHVFMPFFNSDGTYLYHSGYYDESNPCYTSGMELKNRINNQFLTMEDNIKTAIASNFQVTVSTYNLYDLTIGNSMIRNNVYSKEYTFDKDCNVTANVYFDDNLSDLQTIKDSLNNHSNYSYTINFTVELNSNDNVSNFNIDIFVNTEI